MQMFASRIRRLPLFAAALSILLIGLPQVPGAANPSDTLRVGVNSKTPARGNPYAAGFSIPSVYYWAAIFDSLTRIDNRGQILPMLAESWSVGADDLTWTFKLKRGVKFTNGETVNADAVVTSYNWLLHDDLGKTMSMARETTVLDTVTKVDDYTVAIKTKKPNPLWPGSAATLIIIAPKAWKDMGIPAYTAKPATTGPWEVESWTDQKAVFVLNKDSYRPGNIPRMTIIEIPEPVARTQALLSEQIDIATNMGPEDVRKIRAAGHKADIATSPNIMNVALFTEDFTGKWGDKGTPFRDRRVRQAVNYAIDRNSIVENLAYGLTSPASQPANPNTFGYNSDVKPYPYDPEKAKQLLAEAGYPDGFKFVSEVLTGFSPNDAEIYQFVASSLGRIGIEMELRRVPFSDWLKKFLNGTWEGDSTTLSYLVEPHMDAIRPFRHYSCLLKKKFTCIEEEMDLINAASVEMDKDKREQLLKQLMRVAHDDAISLPIQENVEISGLNKRVEGFVNWNKVLRYEDITFAE